MTKGPKLTQIQGDTSRGLASRSSYSSRVEIGFVKNYFLDFLDLLKIISFWKYL